MTAPGTRLCISAAQLSDFARGSKDKNFGELVFLLRRPHPCIVRFVGIAATHEAAAIKNLIERHSAAMQQAIFVVTGNRVRIQ